MDFTLDERPYILHLGHGTQPCCSVRKMNQILQLTSREKLPAIRGMDAYVVCGVPGLNPRTFVGFEVVLDGILVTVCGVETHAVSDETVTGKDFVVCVRPKEGRLA